MRKTLILLLLINFQNISSQKIYLHGTAQTEEKRGIVRIELNDTLKKIRNKLPDSIYRKMLENKNIICYSDLNGRFSISADLKDSLVFSRSQYFSQTHKIADLYLKKDSLQIILKPFPCIEYIPCKEINPELYIFIGEKLNVSTASQPNYCNSISMDSKYKSNYKILKKITENINIENIEFVSYDHFSRVKYDEFQNVLLFVGKYCNELIHQKYKYQPVYKMKNGNWATPVFEEYNSTKMKSEKQPHKVEMAEPITIPKCQSYRAIEEVYKKPYFEIKNGKVYMLYGFFPEDLITK